MCQIIPHQQSTLLYFSSHDTICQGAGCMHVIIHNQIINNLNKSVLGQVSLILKFLQPVNWLHTYEDYDTNLRLPASFGGLKVLQCERHTENTPGIHWCSLQGKGNSQ